MNSQPVAFHWSWFPQTWMDVVQGLAWIVLIAAVIPFGRHAAGVLRQPSLRRRALLLLLLAIAARLVVPLLPFNWYSGVANVDLGGPIYSKDTTYMPLPTQLLTFTFGFGGILLFNIMIGSLSAVCAWYAARLAGYGDRVAVLLGVALAVTPMYARLSASDSTHMMPLPLWWLGALALLRLLRGDGGRVEQVVLFATSMVAAPIRIEAGLVVPSILLFAARDFAGMQRAWQLRRRWLAPFALGVIGGLLCSALINRNAWANRLGGFDIRLWAFQVPRLLFIVDLELLGWIPVFYVLLIWFYAFSKWRRGDWREVAATVLPFAIFSIPYVYAAKGLAGELPSTAYGVTIDMFLLLAVAKGAALLYERVNAATTGQPQKRVAAALLAAIVLVGSFIVPYRKTYAYMNEFAFLRDSLPHDPATILALWDPNAPGGDYDCCLALPYPTFIADFPNLRWQILKQEDAEPSRLRDLKFDYYYPGSLVAIDVDHLNTWFIGRFFPDPEMNARQQAPLRKLRFVDEFIRNHYALEVYRQASLPAHTFSWAPFAGDRMTLTVYRATHSLEGAGARRR